MGNLIETIGETYKITIRKLEGYGAGKSKEEIEDRMEEIYNNSPDGTEENI